MADPFVGEVRPFPFNFAPKGWAMCQGQVLPIAQNTALFSLLGTIYGGNGQTTFALPDLRGRAAMNFGQGPGLSARDQGESSGIETVTLTVATMPQHAHTLSAGGTMKGRNAVADRSSPSNAVPAVEAAGLTATYSNAGSDAAMRAGAVTFAGTATAANAGQAGAIHDNHQPYLMLNYCIALQGVFPQRP